jgi:hypothetical protein
VASEVPDGVRDDNDPATSDHNRTAADNGATYANHHRVNDDRRGSSELMGSAMSDNGHKHVTVYAPTAHGVLSAQPPNGEATADDVITYQAGLLAASNARLQELELALNTITNLAGCAIKFMLDKGYGDEEAADTMSFSRDYLDRMRNCNLTLREDFAGGYTVTFRERADAQLGRE